MWRINSSISILFGCNRVQRSITLVIFRRFAALSTASTGKQQNNEDNRLEQLQLGAARKCYQILVFFAKYFFRNNCYWLLVQVVLWYCSKVVNYFGYYLVPMNLVNTVRLVCIDSYHCHQQIMNCNFFWKWGYTRPGFTVLGGVWVLPVGSTCRLVKVLFSESACWVLHVLWHECSVVAAATDSQVAHASPVVVAW